MQQSSLKQLDYKVHGSFTSQFAGGGMFSSKASDFKRARDAKFEEKKMQSSSRDMILPTAIEDGGN